jgi:hypothetical protein
MDFRFNVSCLRSILEFSHSPGSVLIRGYKERKSRKSDELYIA